MIAINTTYDIKLSTYKQKKILKKQGSDMPQSTARTVPPLRHYD
jgi:hypothetical protein